MSNFYKLLRLLNSRDVIKIKKNVIAVKNINSNIDEIIFNKKMKKCFICDKIKNDNCDLCINFKSVYFIKQFS